MTIDERRRRRFSEEFRKEQVCLIESGRVSIIEVSRLHEVKVESVKRWLVRFGKKKLPEKIIVDQRNAGTCKSLSRRRLV